MTHPKEPQSVGVLGSPALGSAGGGERDTSVPTFAAQLLLPLLEGELRGDVLRPQRLYARAGEGDPDAAALVLPGHCTGTTVQLRRTAEVHRLDAGPARVTDVEDLRDVDECVRRVAQRWAMVVFY